MQKNFSFTAVPDNGVYRITLSGRLTANMDLSGLRNFRADKAIRFYLLDVTALERIDSQGTALFVGLLSMIRNEGGTCHAFGANEIITDLFELFSLTTMLTLFADEQSAVRAFTA